MNRELQLQLYHDFIVNCTTNAKSVKNYSDFKRINECLALLFPNKQNVSILDFDEPAEFEDVIKELSVQKQFTEYEKRGGNQYSNTLKHYLRYLYAKVLFSKSKESVSININDDFPLQQIFYGAPGTGKSNTIKREVEDKGRIHFRTTFHPDSDYSTFVGCYKPTKEEKGDKSRSLLGKDELVAKLKEYRTLYDETMAQTQFGYDYYEELSRSTELADIIKEAGVKTFDTAVRIGMSLAERTTPKTKQSSITYSFVPQAFTKAYCEAWNRYDGTEESEPVFLIIEEINRGNCAQIFGDIFQLLDRKGGFSEYPIDADEDLKKFLLNGTKEDGTPWLVNKDGIKDGQLCLLPNLYIWATMNTSDQSLFPIDSAFKRRWDWKYVPIDNNKEKWSIVAKGVRYSWSDFLRKMNDLVASTTDSEDKMLGFYFAKAKNGIIDADTFVGKVVFYLWNDVFKDYGLPKEILNGAESKEFAFRNFFMVDGHANEDMVRCLLGNLKVKSFDDYYGSVQKNHLEEDNDPNEFLNNEGVISKFTYNGQPTKYLYEIPYKVVQDYVDAHSEMSAQQVHDYFNSKFDIPNCGISHFIETEKEYHNRDGQKYQEKSAKPLTMHNGETIYVSAIWRAKEQNDNFFNFIKIAKENNWGTIKRQEQAN